jgi:hypothetical protein
MPIILSLVRKIGARLILRLEKHIPNRIIMPNTPSISIGLRERLTLIIKARARTAIAWKMLLTPADKALPRTIAERGAGDDRSLFSSPRSRSQTTVIP